MANRYSQYVQGVNYSPESFKDMSVVPIALRQRHDAALAAQDDMLLQLNNIQVRDEDRDYLNQKREEITNQVNGLTNKINTIGAGDSNLMGEFRNMKRAYNQEVSLAGGLGQASNVKERVDAARANYLDFGVKQGWSPETAQKNFELEYNSYNEKNPSSKLGTPGFAFGEFNPTFAPKQINPVDKLKEIQPLIGKIAEEEAFQNYKPVTDPTTGQITYVQYGGTKLSDSNLERLKSVEKYLNQELLNPDSELRQSLRYSRPGVPEDQVVQQFLTESDFLIDAMGVEAKKVATQLEAPKVTKATEDKSKAKSSDETASLVSTPTGAETFEGKSITDIMNGTDIKRFEELEKRGVLSEQDSALKTQTILQQDRVKESLKNPSVVKEINNNLNINGIEGIKPDINSYKATIDNYQSQINSIKQTKLYQLGADLRTSGFISPEARNLSQKQKREATREFDKVNYLENRLAPIKETLDNAFNKSIPKEDLKYSRMYTFGAGLAAKKAMDTFNANATDYGVNWITQIENAGGKFTLPGETDLNGNNDESELKELKETFANGTTKLKFGSIIDMGSTGSSQLVINYTTGTGDKAKTGMLSIDYDNKTTDSSVIDNWLIEMQKTLDVPGQAVIQSILDNKQLKGLSVDNEEFSKKGFSKGQSDTIKKLSNVTNAGYANNAVYKAVNYNNYPGREYNMVLNKDGFYTLMMQDGKNKEVTPLGAGAWLNKELAKDYLSKRINTTNIFKATELNDKKYFVSTMKDLTLLADNNLLQIGSNSSSFQKLKNDYVTQVNNNANNVNLQYELAIQFYNDIKGMTISHKNKKRNL